jgi:hypothetical protein
MGNPSQKRRVLCLGLGLLLVFASISFISRPAAPTKLPEAAHFTFVHMTNAPLGHYPFAVFCVSNTAPYPIAFRGSFFEVESDPNMRAPIVNPSLPESMWGPGYLAPFSSTLVAYGEPADVEPGIHWRPIFRYARYSWRERYFNLATRRKWPLKIGPVVLADPQAIFSATNYQVSINGEWLPIHKPLGN